MQFVQDGVVKLDKLLFLVLDEADRMIDNQNFKDVEMLFMTYKSVRVDFVETNPKKAIFMAYGLKKISFLVLGPGTSNNEFI